MPDLAKIRGSTIIECFGIPGVGKTFVALSFLTALERAGGKASDQGIRINNASSLKRIATKLTLILRLLITNPALLLTSTRLVRIHSLRYSLRFLKLVVNWLYVIALIRSNSGRPQILVLDQGLGQALWSTVFYGSEPPVLESVVDLLKDILPGHLTGRLVIFHITAANETVSARIDAREGGGSPLDREPGLLARAIEATESSLEVLTALAHQSPYVDIFECRNDGGAKSDSGAALLDCVRNIPGR